MSRSTVMVLDDEEASLECIPYFLRHECPELDIEPIRSPHAALDQLRSRDYGLLLTDLQMPGMDGLDVLREAKLVRPETPVVLMSGHTSMEILTLALRDGAFDFLPKTLSRDEFGWIVRLAVETHRLRREVKARRLMRVHLSHQVAALDSLLQPVEGRPVPSRIRDRLEAARWRTKCSLNSMQQSFEQVKVRDCVLEELLKESEARLQEVQIEAQFRALKRFDDNHRWQ